MRSLSRKGNVYHVLPGAPRERVILHVDMDAFFASVEELSMPALKGKPVIVSGDPEGRTVVAAANYCARERGVKAGMPAGQARRLCPNAVFIEGTPEKYVFFSLKLKSICLQFTPLVEPYSIDESFLDVTGTCDRFGGPIPLALELKRKIKEQLSLSASVGIASNKLLAKVASSLKKPNGLSTLFQGELEEKFYPLPIDGLLGVGERTAQKLRALGLYRIDDVRRFSRSILERIFGIAGTWLHQAANGVDHSPVIPEESAPPIKSVGNGYTFPLDSSDEKQLLRVLVGLSAKVGRRLRKDSLAGRTISLTIRFHDYKTMTRSLTTGSFVCLDKEIFEVARVLLLSVACDDLASGNISKVPVKKLKSHFPFAVRYLGIAVSNLVHSPLRQLEWIDWQFWRKYDRAVKTMDSIRDQWGERAVTWGSLVREVDEEKE